MAIRPDIDYLEAGLYGLLAMTDMLTNVIERTLREKLGQHGLDHVEVSQGLDHSGEEALFVLAVLAPQTPLIPGEVSIGANVALNANIRELGETRFAYLHIQHPDDERPETASEHRASPVS